MKWKALAAGATLVNTVLFSYAQPSAIDEKKFVVIEGIEQWITIKGKTDQTLRSYFYTVGLEVLSVLMPKPFLRNGKENLSWSIGIKEELEGVLAAMLLRNWMKLIF